MGSVYRSRLKGNFDKETALFVSSINEDKRIFEEDIDGTEAHNIMLYEQGILSREDLEKILSVLEKLRSEWKDDTVKLCDDFEDVHEFIEAYVIDKIGIETGGKVHTGRSRNDQVALDIRMRLRSELNETSEMILRLVDTLLEGAEEHVNTLMILYTHTQQAQIGVFSHYLLAYVDALLRDFRRLQDCYARVNLNPLGAGPIGGSCMDLDRVRTSLLLGFDAIIENSIDAVSTRDFALETASSLAILMSNLNRIAEDFIIWSSTEVGYLEIADEYASVSSIMPHKKNPCTLELIRGKMGRVQGSLVNLLTMIKGLSTGYHRDLQETKPPLWEGLDAVKASLRIMRGIIATVKVNNDRMREMAVDSYAFAVDLAELLVEESLMTFREAHVLVGNLVKEMVASDLKPSDLNDEMLQDLARRILGKRIPFTDAMVKTTLDLDSCLLRRKTLGSPSPKEVRRMIAARRKLTKTYEAELESNLNKLSKSRVKLLETVNNYLHS